MIPWDKELLDGCTMWRMWISINKEGTGLPSVSTVIEKETDAQTHLKKRINISVTPSVLRAIDAAAKSAGMTRSGYIAKAARDYIAEREARVPIRD